MDPSPALALVGKYPPSLEGRCVGILVTDGVAGDMLGQLKRAIESAGASVKIIAPKIGGVTLQDGSHLKADAQLQGAPSVLFDAVALVISEKGCDMLMKEGAATDFVKDAFGHLKAIGWTAAAKPLLKKAGVVADGGVIELDERHAKQFAVAAATRQWDREPSVRTPV